MLSAFAEYTRCPDVLVDVDARALNLAFDPTEEAERLRREQYLDNRLPDDDGLELKAVARRAYYAVRPLLPVAVRRHAQRWALRDWRSLTFPAWPVDVSVDRLMNGVFKRLLEVHGRDELPFIWFWPEGHTACSIMTHDVETAAGRDFSGVLMRMEAERGIHSAFEIVPEERYHVPAEYLDRIRSAGCEVCIHGLNHDGRLFQNEALFLERAKKINAYARQFGATGFRSPVMYRRVDWYQALEVRYDMSLPNVAHLDPQRGGCCTVMPYFIGGIVELPLTTTQDYQLYNILRRCDLELWEQQTEIVLTHHGLLSFIIHPDYTTSTRAQDLYGRLLDYLVRLRDERNVWLALPGDVDRWWRTRRQLRLVSDGTAWRIVGDGHERARVAFAYRDAERVRYRFADTASAVPITC